MAAELEGKQSDHPNAGRDIHLICTIGPKYSSVEKLQEMIQNGMSVCRLDMARGSHQFYTTVVQNLREAMVRTDKVCAIMLHLQGPRIRTGNIIDPIHLFLRLPRLN